MEFNLNLTGLSEENRAVPLSQDKIYDVIIIGGGPAALTAAVYCMRKGVSTALVASKLGGQVAETGAIENYMGYKYIDGTVLTDKFKEQVKQFEIGIAEDKKAMSITDGKIKKITLHDGSICRSKAIIITTGKSWRRLGVPGETEFTGKGVAYCAICDAPLFAGKNVTVVGGGNSGIAAAIDLAKIASHVTIVQALPKLTADRVLVDTFETYKNKEILYEHGVTAIKGDKTVKSISVINRLTNQIKELKTDAVFIEIGLIPNTDFVKNLVELNDEGEILVDCGCKTNRPGIFAAGDATIVPYKQIIIAAGEGAKAALAACDYVLKFS